MIYTHNEDAIKKTKNNYIFFFKPIIKFNKHNLKFMTYGILFDFYYKDIQYTAYLQCNASQPLFI